MEDYSFDAWFLLGSRVVSFLYMLWGTIQSSHPQPDVPKLLVTFAWGLWFLLMGHRF